MSTKNSCSYLGSKKSRCKNEMNYRKGNFDRDEIIELFTLAALKKEKIINIRSRNRELLKDRSIKQITSKINSIKNIDEISDNFWINYKKDEFNNQTDINYEKIKRDMFEFLKNSNLMFELDEEMSKLRNHQFEIKNFKKYDKISIRITDELFYKIAKIHSSSEDQSLVTKDVEVSFKNVSELLNKKYQSEDSNDIINSL